MTDFLNKLIEIVLVFMLLVLAPITISYMASEMVTQRVALNEVSQFIDRVTDKHLITRADIDDLYMGLGNSGGVFDVEVKRYVPVAVPITDDTKAISTRSTYISCEDIDTITATQSIELNVSDVVKVTVKEVTMSQAKKMLWSILNLDSGKLEFSLAGSVR